MGSEEATLLAAGVAAVASTCGVLLNLINSHGAEFRAAHRQSIAPFLPELSEAIHSTIATANILSKAKSEESIENWRERSEKAKTALKKLRIQLRYPLWGLSDHIRTVIRIPDWVEHARPFPSTASDLVVAARQLGLALDSAIRRSYVHGRPPTLLDRFLIGLAARRVRKVYATMGTPDEDVSSVSDEETWYHYHP
jgi:hypothetical protein